MLHADKLAFEANLAQDLVAIQMKELDYLYKNLANLATSSAVLTFDVLEQISQMAVAAGVAYAPDEKGDDGGWSWWPFGRGAERPDSAERERRREALGQPTSRRTPPKSKKNVKLDVEMGGAESL